MRFKAIIFDLDGTLVTTSPEYRYRVTRSTLDELKVKNKSKESIDRFWFGSNRDKIIRDSFGVDPEKFWDVFRKYDDAKLRKNYTKPFDDVQVIKKLKDKGYKIGLVTGSPVWIASMELEMLGKDYFDVIVIAQNSSGIKPKPHPHGLEECLSILEVSNEEAVYVGNSDEDIMTARSARVFIVLVNRREHKIVGSIKPSLMINSLYELEKILDER